MDDIKLFAKKRKELETLLQPVSIYSRNLPCYSQWVYTVGIRHANNEKKKTTKDGRNRTTI